MKYGTSPPGKAVFLAIISSSVIYSCGKGGQKRRHMLVSRGRWWTIIQLRTGKKKLDNGWSWSQMDGRMDELGKNVGEKKDQNVINTK